MSWDKLSMAEKADIMKLAVESGIYDLDTIRNEYNTFAGGGSTKDDDLVDWIIKEEGFNTKPEDIGDGKMTLGSGLTAQKWHDLYKKRGNKWSAQDNRRAVAEEVTNRRRWAEKTIPNWDSLPESSQKALLSYKYNYDFTPANSPKLFQALKDSNLREAARQMDATSKDPKFRKGLKDRRLREQQWFLSDVSTPQVVPTASYAVPAVSTQVVNPYIMQSQNEPISTKMIPNEGSYVEAHRLTPYEERLQRLQDRWEAINDYNRVMKAVGIKNNPIEKFISTSSLLDPTILDPTYANGGKIHIKPSHRGRLTELKARTGKSEQELYNDGNPAHKKMVVFARNARKWKHDDGGNLYGGDNKNGQQMQLGLKVTNGWQPYSLEQVLDFAAINEANKAAQEAAIAKRVNDYLTTSNDATAVADGRLQNQHLTERAIEGAKAHRAWEKDNPTLAVVGNVAGAVPLAVASLPAVVPAMDALASTAVGQLATKALTHPISEAVGVSMAGGHGLSDLFSGNTNALTALELAPLAFPYGNFAKGTGEAINYLGSKIPTPVKEAWANRAENAAMLFGDEGKTWARVTDAKGKEGVVFLNTNNNWKTAADWLLHPQQTYRDFRNGYYPMTRKQWKSYLTEEQKALDYAKQKAIELNDAQLNQRLALQQESFLDNRARNNSASIKIDTNPNNPFSLPRAPRNASEVADNVKVVSRNKDVSYGGKWFDPKFGTGTAAVSHPDKNVIVLPRHYQTQFSNRLATMPGRGYTSPIETRMHTYVHELQHQMQQNLPLLNLSQPNATTMYYEPWDHFLSNIDSENLLLPFKETAQKYPGSWLASPNEYNAESNAFRVVDDYKGRRNILDPLDERSATRLNPFGLNFDQIESLWNMGYKRGGHLRK